MGCPSRQSILCPSCEEASRREGGSLQRNYDNFQLGLFHILLLLHCEGAARSSEQILCACERASNFGAGDFWLLVNNTTCTCHH